MTQPKIHLVTFATSLFKPRQVLLCASARANRVVDTTTSWGPKSLLESGIKGRIPHFDVQKRGAGYWAWKPYIILKKLDEVQDNDIVFYCDVGRLYPLKTLQSSLKGYCDWMKEKKQSVMPGVYIPWKGPMSMWTKRAAFAATGQDTSIAHSSIPIQASFSLWQANAKSRELVASWLDLCCQVELIDDSPSPSPLNELSNFFEHRHDQSLLSLCCMARGVHGIDLSFEDPGIDTRHPDEVLACLGVPRKKRTLLGKMIALTAQGVGKIEFQIRKRHQFGERYPEPKPKPH